jgi:MbtH protein
MPENDEDDRTYKVVVNHEEQYSIWFADREPPTGWREAGRPRARQPDPCP